MLTELHIENFAIIKDYTLHPSGGLVIITGETGAGKSIMFDAIGVLVGGKTDVGMIRGGADKALIEGTFLVSESQTELLELLEKESLLDEPKENVKLINLSREIKNNGKSVARINGVSVSLGLLQQVGGYFVDIHGQSEHLSLLNVKSHLKLLDDYCSDEVFLASYLHTYNQLLTIRKKKSELENQIADANRLKDLYQYQQQEISQAKIKPGELAVVKQERDRLANAESLALNVQKALQSLTEGTEETASISDQMGNVVKCLNLIGRLDASMNDAAEQAQILAESVDDLSGRLSSYLDLIEYNPRRLEQLEERYEIIKGLLKKYGSDEQAVIDFGVQLEKKLETIIGGDEEVKRLAAEEEKLRSQLSQQAAEISDFRQKAAKEMGMAIEKELAELSMNGARFKVEFKTKPDEHGLLTTEGDKVAFNQSGWDVVEFLIAPNIGEGLKPLAKVASGGETSRLMLALKNVLAQVDPVPTLIFDEIDQGIGGRVGTVVGRKLYQLGKKHQVFCVTHLPQLAAFSQEHYHVQKHIDDGRTSTETKLLDYEERIEELANMMGVASETNRKSAQELLDAAQKV